ncbi:MAG TPA: hypothetical protein VFJ01_06200 [Oleiagrimonas sp.]|nr:hypothetical protein [Oleiagrimonas sp.]
MDDRALLDFVKRNAVQIRAALDEEAPQKVRVVNAVPPQIAVDCLDSPEGEDIILNTISRQKDRIAAALRDPPYRAIHQGLFRSFRGWLGRLLPVWRRARSTPRT